MLGVLPAAAQTTGIQPVWLLAEDTSRLGDLLVGPGVAEVPAFNPGATTAGGTVSWVKYFEKDDHLGMHHVYYRQQYQHPQLGRALKLLGSAVSLHYAPDGSLSYANLAQVSDIPPLPNVALSTPQQAFAAAQLGLASWPGFRLGDPSRWPPGTLASILDRFELMLEAPRAMGSWRLVWRIQIPDADWESYTGLVDAATGELLWVAESNPKDSCPPEGCSHCSPGHDDMPAPVFTATLARPERPDLGDLRNVASNQFTNPYEQELNCSGGSCSYEAVWAADAGIPQIEIYHGMDMSPACRHCMFTNGIYEGKYMRVGLKAPSLGWPTYDDYPQGKGTSLCGYSTAYRRFAGDAMFYTRETMEVFSASFERCGFDGVCGVARVVVDSRGASAPQFWARLPEPDTFLAPLKSVRIGAPGSGSFSASAALDVVAHEWGHGVDNFSPGNLVDRCADTGVLETCEMMEGFADVVGHIVERLTQPPDPNPSDDDYDAEHWDWTAQEDWAPETAWPILRRADRYASNPCPGAHHSVHADDQGCGGGYYSANGNRLAVVLKLMTDGGNNPGAGQVQPCTGCDIDVTPLDPDATTSFEMAAKILFRVLDTEADSGTADWDDLPYHARNAARVLYPNDCEVQRSVIQAFRAVGYPQQLAVPCPVCPPYRTCPPCCPPDYCCGVVEE